MDHSSVAQNRRSRRSPVLLTARIEIDGAQVAVKLRNLSDKGALIEGERLPSEGSDTCFRRNELERRSRIVWVEGKFAGVAFDSPLDPDEVLRHIPSPAPKPASPVGFRRPGFTCRPLSDYERENLERWLATAPPSRD